MNAAALLTRDPRRLAALCDLWRSAGSEVRITLQGRSMTPSIPPGSRLRLLCRPWTPQPGEVIAYRREGMLVVHRLLRCEGEHLILQGDANTEPDPPVLLQDVVGLVVEVQRPSAAKRAWWRLRGRLRRMRGERGAEREVQP